MFTGVIEKILAEPGDKVAVGTVLAVIRSEDREEEPAAAASPPPERRARTAGRLDVPRAAAGRLRVSPVA